jgi:bifunctional pyridoxal-dependent enzyme with beta-cystathionase and maltose regulon repressor activities
MTDSRGGPLLVSADDYLFFVARALRGMCDIVVGLGDPLACTRPDLPGANTPFGLLTHCLGVVDYWGGHLVAGRRIDRDRDAEFDATGSVAELAERVEWALRQLADDVASVEPGGRLHSEPADWAQGPDRPLDPAGALVHLYEELAQHHGQMEVLRDVLSARIPSAVDPVPDFDDVPLGWLRQKRGVKWHRPGPDLLPAWVADMDFPIAPAIQQAILAAVTRGDLGYPGWPAHPLAQPFAQRMSRRYGWSPDPGFVRGVTDLIQAVQIVLTLATSPGDGVVVHTPNYPPFLETVRRMNRVLIPAPLEPGDAAGWSWDHDRLERDVARSRPTVVLLVNPHNPTGRVFTRPELTRIAELAERHEMLVISDEIHAELVHAPNVHIPFASLDPATATAARTVTVTSATKAFNIAGLRVAVAHVGSERLRAAWDRQPPDLFGAPNVLGVEATLAAWSHGDAWLTALNRHLLARRDQVIARLGGTPLRVRPPEAGYLAWLDCRDAGTPIDPAAWFREHTSVELSSGPDFGPGNEHRARLNFATTGPMLDVILDRMITALAEPVRRRSRA